MSLARRRLQHIEIPSRIKFHVSDLMEDQRVICAYTVEVDELLVIQ